MKKMCIVIITIMFLIVLCFTVWKVAEMVTSNNIIKNIQIDGVDEIEKGIVTIKLNDNYYNYKYEFIEGFKTYEERQADR